MTDAARHDDTEHRDGPNAREWRTDAYRLSLSVAASREKPIAHQGVMHQDGLPPRPARTRASRPRGTCETAIAHTRRFDMLHRSYRSLILTALLAIATIASTLPMYIGAQEASPATGCAPLAAETIRARAQEFVDAMNAEDLDRLGETLHDDHATHWGIGSEVHDRERYLASIGRLFKAFDDFSFTADAIIVTDNIAVVRVTVSGTQVLEFIGFPPSGQPATWTGMYIFEFEECGRIVEAWAEFDHLGRLIRQGTIVPPAATPAP
jgi:steroid delta-isomerase-like uncharacterized protein